MHPDKELAQHFLKRIHHYYPIGMPGFPHDYQGYKELLQIQEDKFKDIEREEPKVWYNLVNEIREQWQGRDVFNGVGAQFPCYEANILLSNESRTGLNICTSLTLSLSLLVDYYSIVVFDEYSYMGPINSGVQHRFVCSGMQHHLQLDAKIDDLKRIVSKHFPGYIHARHDVLFKYKVDGGVPYKGSYDDKGEYTIYDYLFSGGLLGQQYTVAH